VPQENALEEPREMREEHRDQRHGEAAVNRPRRAEAAQRVRESRRPTRLAEEQRQSGGSESQEAHHQRGVHHAIGAVEPAHEHRPSGTTRHHCAPPS
jgi:hypothetical protein